MFGKEEKEALFVDDRRGGKRAPGVREETDDE